MKPDATNNSNQEQNQKFPTIQELNLPPAENRYKNDSTHWVGKGLSGGYVFSKRMRLVHLLALLIGMVITILVSTLRK